MATRMTVVPTRVIPTQMTDGIDLFIEGPRFAEVLCSPSPILDVRAPAEYDKSHLPNSISAPIMQDAERKQIGTCYKQNGREAAIELGHALVSGDSKEQRVDHWAALLRNVPEPILYCARGGLRSQIAQQWLAERNIRAKRVQGGYKALRRFLLGNLEALATKTSLLVLAGHTGAGKTKVLNQLRTMGVPIVDLEQLANHRGSAFGRLGEQPHQATFENRLSIELLKLQTEGAPFVVIESESRAIGRNWLPDALCQNMQRSPVVVLECSFEQRVLTIIEHYVVGLERSFQEAKHDDPYASLETHLLEGVDRLKKRLGGVQQKRIRNQILDAMDCYRNGASAEVHANWVAALLSEYYDRFYQRHIVRHSQRTIYSAEAKELLEFIFSSWQEGYLPPLAVRKSTAARIGDPHLDHSL